jgi:DNA-binding transcriptional LysR family regulator
LVGRGRRHRVADGHFRTGGCVVRTRYGARDRRCLCWAGCRICRNALDGTDRAIEHVNAFRDKPSGALHLNVSWLAASLLVGRRLPGFLAKFPDIKLEIAADETHSDIVSSRFDAGVRVRERIAKDMIAVRLLEGQRNMAVASPAYLAQHWDGWSSHGILRTPAGDSMPRLTARSSSTTGNSC